MCFADKCYIFVYKNIWTTPIATETIREGELVSYNPLEEELEVNLIEDDLIREETPTIGYYNLQKTMNNLSKQIDALLKKMTQVQIPTGKAPRKVVLPKRAEMDVNTPRGPPTAAPKVNVGLNSDMIKSQMETIEKEMDLIESKIGGQKKKLTELRKQYEATFNEKRKNQLNEQILKTENSIVQLIKKMDVLGLRYTKLESKMQSATKIKGMPTESISLKNAIPSSVVPKDISKNASKGLSGLPRLMSSVSKTATKSAVGFRLFGNATKSAKKNNDYFKNGLGGTIRQMFKWNKNNTGTAIVQALFDIFNTILDTINQIIGATADWAKELDFSPLLTSVQTLLEAIAPFAETVGDGLSWFWSNVLLPIAGWAIQTAVPTFLDMLSAALGALNAVLTALQPFGTWFYDNLLKPLGEWAGEVFILAMQTITDLLKQFSDWCAEHQTTIGNIAIIIGSLATAFFAVKTTVDLVTGVLSTVGNAFKFLTSPVGIATLAIGAAIAIGVLLWKNWDEISAKAKEVWESVKKKFQEFMDFLKNVFTRDWTTELGVIGKVINGLLKNITNIVDDIKQVFKGVIDFVAGVFTGDWSRAWDGIKNILSGVWNGFVDIVKSPINIVIGLINGLLYGVETMVNGVASALNGISIDLPGWLEDLTGYSSIGFNLPYWSAPQIPYLAQGGYVKANTPQLAMIGDNKRHGEIVAPEDKMQAMVNAAVKAVAGSGGVSKAELESIINNAVMRIVAALGQMGFYLDGELLARAVQAIQDGLDVRYNPVKMI